MSELLDGADVAGDLPAGVGEGRPKPWQMVPSNERQGGWTLLRAVFFGRREALPTAALAIMAVFAVASLANELIYQRHWWFIMGLALMFGPAERHMRDRTG